MATVAATANRVALLTNIGDMIDLAIGSPEIGVVDFCMLHTVLHCLAQQLAVLDKNVELRGAAAATAIGAGKEVANTVAVNEFVVEPDGKKPDAKPMKVHERKHREEPDTLLVVERVRREGTDRIINAVVEQSPAVVAQAPGSAGTAAAPASPGGTPPLSTPLSLVTVSKFNLLQSAVDDLKNRVYGSMPGNEELLQEVRSQTNLKAITDMWTSLNVSSRLEAAEEGIAKLSSLVQDLIRDTPSTMPQAAVSATSRVGVAPPPPAAPSPAAPSAAPAAPSGAPSAPSAPGVSQDQLNLVFAHMKQLRDELDSLSNTFYIAMKDLKSDIVQPPPPPQIQPPLEVVLEPKPTPSQVQALPVPVKSTESRAAAPGAVSTAAIAARPAPAVAEFMDRLLALEKRIGHCCENMGKNEGTIQDKMENFQDQLAYLMKQVADITADLATGKLSPDLIKDLQGLMQLFQTVQEMKAQLQQVHETALQLAAEKDDRQYHMNALLEQIELLKTIKLDREDMVEAMADKADLRMLARKVSHDQFEMACDDLSKGLELTIGKLNMQESLWQQALDDIQREIETKLDRMELSPVKDFFNKKLRQLQEHLKQLASLRREAEAAGTKRKLLRDVNCISCDAQAVMATEAGAAAASKPLPAHLSMKPYLSYELDAIRKAQSNNVPQRNLHDWEAIDKQMSHPKQTQKVRSDADKHICNRYCGGSHTVTTPAQRVARTGHFIKQWGPDVVPLSSGFATGDDGRMYKVSTVEAANVGPGGAVDATCTKRPKSVDAAKAAPKPIAAECRCLE